MDLSDCCVLQHLIDNRIWVFAVVHLGIANPASLVVGPEDLWASTPLWRVPAGVDWAPTGRCVDENGTHLTIWTGWEHRLVTEQKEVLPGGGVPQAAPQRFTPGRGDLDNGVPGRVGSFRSGLVKHVIGNVGDLEGRSGRSHRSRLSLALVDRWRKSDITSRKVAEHDVSLVPTRPTVRLLQLLPELTTICA